MTHNVSVSKIGIIGDGQLALMLAEALVKIGHTFLCLSDSNQSPMHTFFPKFITDDKEKFKTECDIFTLENEFHTVSELKNLLQEKSHSLFPTLTSYSFFTDKISQRRYYESIGITSPKWMPLTNETDLVELKNNFEYPFIIKTAYGGYDGKGVRIIDNIQTLGQALSDFKFHEGNPLLIEEKIIITKEVAQGFIRNKNGQFTLLPLVDTIQENGVCNLVQYPSTVAPNIQKQIESFLEKLIASDLVGIFNFEFFIDQNNNVLINEGAPRTHNSQHLTLDACPLSQFDLLALYLTDPSRAPIKMSTKPSIMVNILGKSMGDYGHLKIPEFSHLILKTKLYGKVKSSPGRKMGHINVIDNDGRSDLLAVGKKILKEYEL